MKVEYLSRFGRDIDRIQDASIKNKLASIIEQIEQAKSLADVNHLKKIVGYKNTYRIRIGDYRIGIFFEKDTVEFARIVHRKDIYKFFP
jgi:mRNA interferase RelE/StbE